MIGPSGSGKSTLCRAINRLETIDKGTITPRRPEAARGGQGARRPSRRGRAWSSRASTSSPTRRSCENVTLGPIKVRGKKSGRGRQARPRAARAGRRGAAGREVPRPALRRPAAARGDRPGPGDGPQGDALRRADLGARPRDDQGGPRRDGRPRQAGHDDDRGHPRDGLRAHGGRPGRLHVRGRDRRGEHPRGVLHQPASRIGPRTSSARSSSTEHSTADRPHTERRSIMRFKRTRALIVAGALALAMAAMWQRRRRRAAATSPRTRSSMPGTTMAKLADAGKITIGTKFDQPGFGLLNLEDKPEGFDVEVAKIIAGALGIGEDDIDLEGVHLRRARAGHRGRRGRLWSRDVHHQRRAQAADHLRRSRTTWPASS